MTDYLLLINLENNLIEELFKAEEAGYNHMLGIVLKHLVNKAREESVTDLERDTYDIIERYGDCITNDETDITIVSLPMDKSSQLELLDELKEYYDEYQLVKDKWENGNSDDDDDEDYTILCSMASDYDDIKFMIESDGSNKTPVVIAF